MPPSKSSKLGIFTWKEDCWVAEFMAADVVSKGSVFNYM